MQKLIEYVNPYAQLPPIVGTKKGALLVIGSAAGVWDDLRRYDHRHGVQDRMVINDMAAYYPSLYHHMVTLHPEKMGRWCFNGAAKHSHQQRAEVDYVWPLTRDGGTSGIFGVFIGLLVGYENIILAGIPCDESPRFFDPPWKKHDLFSLETAFDEWERARDTVPLFNTRVRSLSGNTRLLLGGPDD